MNKKRLDLIISELLSISRTKAQEQISLGYILVNNQIITKSHLLVNETDSIIIEKIHKISSNENCQIYDQIKIIAVENDFIIIDKPAFLSVHRSHESDVSPNVANWFKKSGLFLDSIDLNNFRIGIVHRLDKETSGIMILARNYNAQKDIISLFKNRLIKKTYNALVTGKTTELGIITYNIVRNPLNPTQMIYTNGDGRDAITEFKTITHFNEYSLVECFPKTGRTHQIRVHFKGIGHALIGDKTYGTSSNLINRHALHATSIMFTYKEKEYTFFSKIPDDIKKLIE